MGGGSNRSPRTACRCGRFVSPGKLEAGTGMALKVRCPGCGKNVKVSAADAGQMAVCPACGGRIDVPPPPLLGPVSAAPPLPQAAGVTAAATGVPLVGTVASAGVDEELVTLQTEQSVLAVQS